MASHSRFIIDPVRQEQRANLPHPIIIQPPTSVWFSRTSQNATSCRERRLRTRRLEDRNLPSTPETSNESRQHSSLSRNYSARLFEGLPANIEESQLETLGLIGSGAFGRAWKVRHRQHGCLLVLKEVLNGSNDQEEALVREINLLRNLKHPNILTCIGVVVWNRRISLVTEYIAQGSLHRVLMESPLELLTCCKRVSYARDITAGMTYLHENNLIHRDLTTHNCLVRRDDSVVVSDFGLSKLIRPQPFVAVSRSSDPSSRKISLGRTTRPIGFLATDTRRRAERPKRYTVVGSPFWMAPEMLAGKPYEQSVDVYSFGVILCQLLACCDADPDRIPRNPDNMCVEIAAFIAKYQKVICNSPPLLIDTASRCVSFEPETRPTFQHCCDWLNNCLLYMTTGREPPDDIIHR
ncbi:hypothetical protein P879_03880 [Paragonimus westermani]|uniref:dual-specificity kinase n=1 Tax=Paragonimus westermani TaxID=34504 RepID=A0A8T0DHE0_9TREM|nr:hypothetical protein P879_03880 [Paragonimus westermani]